MRIVTCIAPVNIAVIKYWGKRNEELILPINDSISASLDTNQMCAKTTVMISPDFESDRIWLNGREESIDNKRLQRCIQEIRKRVAVSGGTLSEEICQWKIHICSENNFPTAAGLASSAAGYACLAAALAKLYDFTGNISEIARLGSGSACRSVYGGFVRWYMGSDPTGRDSIAKQIAPETHWPEMRIIVLVVNDSKKKVSSAIGMKRSVETSKLLEYRAKHVPQKVEEMHQAILDKNFSKFAELTMRDSNQMHAVCLDTFPPCFYLNDISCTIIQLINAYNSAFDSIKVAYTNDAGPNTVLYLLEENVPLVLGLIDFFFPPSTISGQLYKKGNPPESITPTKKLLEKIDLQPQPIGSIRNIIYTRIGCGSTQLQNPSEHLLDNNGLPKNIQYL
ncbi:diphosphomevalonate decarboxylase [Chelonus insularis]|uniref:diphosphomevalonate decarboxylase n=1 Tax=Chelonus insularis TaxID=460826 RepID=UPI00158DCDB1|nr:diphosphomevalonate decarboxylase [Chelonus insularis]